MGLRSFIAFENKCCWGWGAGDRMGFTGDDELQLVCFGFPFADGGEVGDAHLCRLISKGDIGRSREAHRDVVEWNGETDGGERVVVLQQEAHTRLCFGLEFADGDHKIHAFYLQNTCIFCVDMV